MIGDVSMTVSSVTRYSLVWKKVNIRGSCTNKPLKIPLFSLTYFVKYITYCMVDTIHYTVQ